MPSLPTKPDKWYQAKDDTSGWTPQTTDIPKEIISQAWNGQRKVVASQNDRPTLRLDGLQILSPLQVGGAKLTEGDVLPAQLGGVPCIPGSCLRGALRHWLNTKWSEIENENTNEHEFWKGLLAEDLSGWKPKAIRFETSFPKGLQAFPLHPQQDWQVFGVKTNQLAVQWQFPAIERGKSSPALSIAVYLRDEITKKQKQWLQNRLLEMLREQGIGRGTAPGFGRVGKVCPLGRWQIQLKGMKPATEGRKYRWNPQVLRACLRGYFTRLALTLMSKEDAKMLTDFVFGGLKNPSPLILSSYLEDILPASSSNYYSNIIAKVADSTWLIQVDCNDEFQELIGGLLKLASQLGGLGPGWRRPPHDFDTFMKGKKRRIYRGSEFEVIPLDSSLAWKASVKDLIDLIDNLKKNIRSMIPQTNPNQEDDNLFSNRQKYQYIRRLAKKYKLRISQNQDTTGSLISIRRQEKKEAWRDIVHKVCSTNPKNRPGWAKTRPPWCGDTKKRPSGYAVRQHDNYCLITVFDRAVEDALENHLQGFEKIWPQ